MKTTHTTNKAALLAEHLQGELDFCELMVAEWTARARRTAERLQQATAQQAAPEVQRTAEVVPLRRAA